MEVAQALFPVRPVGMEAMSLVMATEAQAELVEAGVEVETPIAEKRDQMAAQVMQAAAAAAAHQILKMVATK